MTERKMIIALDIPDADIEEKTKFAYEAFNAIVKIIEENTDPDDMHRREEMDFVVSLVINLMVNRNYCLNCFMTRLMEVITKLENKNILFKHTSEDPKHKPH